MRVNILRQKTPGSEPYWESFDYDGPADNTIAGVLDYINYHDDIIDLSGKRTTRIGWIIITSAWSRASRRSGSGT